MKGSKKLVTLILSLCIVLASTAYCFAATGTTSTPTGTLGGYQVKGTLTVASQSVSAFIGFTNTSSIYGYWTITINATYVNDVTGAIGSKVYSYTTAAPTLKVSWPAPTNCTFTGATATFLGTYNGSSWTDSLSL